MSYRVYPVTKTGAVCEDYEVFINGEKAELNTARVSAVPFNRRWPGHQRQIEQTELVNFLSMEADEEIELCIRPRIPSASVRIRPRSYGANAVIKQSGEICMRVSGTAQFTVEPYGRNRALHVFIDPVSRYGVDRNAPSVLYFGRGVHEVGDLYLEDGQTLFIDEGAVVYATVYAYKKKNISILGRGILDNGKNKEIIHYQTNENTEGRRAVDNAFRAFAVNLVGCDGVQIDGITMRDSLLYNIDAVGCENIHISNIKIIGCWRFNTDGVHFANCRHASLTDSFLRTYDDTICVRGFAYYEYGRFFDPKTGEDLLEKGDLCFECRDVLIRNCVVFNDWGKNLQVGTETYAREITGVTFEDCRLIHTMGKAVTVWLVDNAKIHGVVFKDITVEYDDYMNKPAIQRADGEAYEDRYDPDWAGTLVSFEVCRHFEYSMIKTEEELGSISDVLVDGLSLYGVQKPVFYFRGENEKSSCEDIRLRRILWNGEPISAALFEKQTEKNAFVKHLKFLEETV